jgi:uncharacterized RDD family membrane protein YckC
MTQPAVPYAGVATRGLALAIDAVVAQAIVFGVGAVLALIGSLFGDVRLEDTGKLLAAVAWLALECTYFVVFWASAGQTPGMRVMGVRLTTYDGGYPSIARSVVRFVGLGLAIVPLFLGFVPALVDARRRALQDFLAGTVVLYADRDLPTEREPAAVGAPRDIHSSA